MYFQYPRHTHHTCHPFEPSAQPRWGCLCLWTSPGVAPRRRNPGLHGRIPLGFPEGDSQAHFRKHKAPGIPEGSSHIPTHTVLFGIPERVFPTFPPSTFICVHSRFSPPQRQRRCAIQPGVAPFPALPRVQAAARSLPRKGLCRSCPSGGCDIKGRNGMGFACADAETFQQELPGYTIPKNPIPPVRSFGTTLSGLLICWGCTQGSASAAQPWALWQNPVGIPGGGNARAHPPPGDSRPGKGGRVTVSRRGDDFCKGRETIYPRESTMGIYGPPPQNVCFRVPIHRRGFIAQRG